MSKLLHLSTIRDYRPFIINAECIVSIRNQPYMDDDDEFKMGASLAVLSGREFAVAESCDVVTQLWKDALED